MDTDEERQGKERRSVKSSAITPTAVQETLQQVFIFAGSTGLAADTAESGERHYLVMLSKVDKNVQKISILR